jgi:hypothetical protein
LQEAKTEVPPYGDQIVGVGRIDRDLLFILPFERGVSIQLDVGRCG